MDSNRPSTSRPANKIGVSLACNYPPKAHNEIQRLSYRIPAVYRRTQNVSKRCANPRHKYA